MITKATFKCDNCGKKRISRFPRKDKRSGPKGWLQRSVLGFTVDVCSRKCADEYMSTHSVGFSEPARLVDEEVRKEISKVQKEVHKIQSESYDALAKEFGVPKDLAGDFYHHVFTVKCPKCGAIENESCHPQDEDEVKQCPFHGAEMTLVAHYERTKEAHKTWRQRFQ